MFLRAYLTKLCSDPSTMEFWYYLDKVGYVFAPLVRLLGTLPFFFFLSFFLGSCPPFFSFSIIVLLKLTKQTSSMMHVGRGREHPLHVEYVHIGACLAFIQDTLTEALLSHPRIKMDRKIALIKALGKVIWIQNDLFAKWYVRDGEEYAAEAEKPEFEQEGYLDGRKVLDDIEEGEESSRGAAGGGTDDAVKSSSSDGASSSSGGGNNNNSPGQQQQASPRSPKSPPPMTCPFSGIPIRSKTEDAPAGKVVQVPHAGEVAGA